MRRLLIFFFLCLFILTFPKTAYAPIWGPPGIDIREEDADPRGRCLRLKVANGSLTKNSDGSWSLAGAGSVEGTAVLSTGEGGGTKFLREDGDGTSSWQAAAGGGTMSSFFLEDADGTEVEIDDSKEVKFIESTGIDIDWTDTSTGDDADPFDLTFTISPAAIAGAIGAGEYADDTVNDDDINWGDISNLGAGGACTLSATVTVADDESTDDDHEVVFTTDNATLESDGDFHYSPDTGTVTATEFVGGGSGLTLASTDLSDTASIVYVTDSLIACATIVDPDTVQSTIDAVTILCIEAEKFPNGITITDCGIKTAASSSYSVVFEEWTAPGTHDGDLETVATSTSLEAEDDGTIGNGTGGGAGDCNVGSIIKVDLPADDINELSIWIVFTINQS